MSDSDALTLCAWVLGKAFTTWPADAQSTLAETYCANRKWMADAEALMVERGLGEAYGRELAHELEPTANHDTWDDPMLCFGADVAKIRTAPLPTIVKALAAVIRAKEAADAE